jgi:signal peptidase I
MMGDNRDRSLDSRFWGFVETRDLVGRALVLYFSWDGRADDILHYVRWTRIGKLIR